MCSQSSPPPPRGTQTGGKREIWIAHKRKQEMPQRRHNRSLITPPSRSLDSMETLCAPHACVQSHRQRRKVSLHIWQGHKSNGLRLDQWLFSKPVVEASRLMMEVSSAHCRCSEENKLYFSFSFLIYVFYAFCYVHTKQGTHVIECAKPEFLERTFGLKCSPWTVTT